MILRVECYSGRKADERPIRFHLGSRDCSVEAILDQWYGPGDSFFRVRAGDGNVYVLRHNTARDEWSLDQSRRSKYE